MHCILIRFDLKIRSAHSDEKHSSRLSPCIFLRKMSLILLDVVVCVVFIDIYSIYIGNFLVTDFLQLNIEKYVHQKASILLGWLLEGFFGTSLIMEKIE